MERSHLLMTLLGLGQIGRRKAELICEHNAWTIIEAGLSALAAKGLLPETATPTAIEQAARSAATHISTCARNGWQIINKFDASFPARLRQIADAPLVLYCHGELAALAGSPAVAVVGSRAASPAAVEIAYRLGQRLALLGIPVISGLALGCDTAAHLGCLEHGGYTAAVLPTGLDRLYPPQNADLFAQIARRGCLLSEYPPGIGPAKYRFVERDRIQSGLSDIVIIVETELNGGAMHTARFARRQGRRLLVFSPDSLGGVKATGNRRLLATGAEMVASVDAAISAVISTRPGQRYELGSLF